MKSSGNTGRSGGVLREDPELLRGVLASDYHRPVYPDDRCLQCEREGKVTADELCFHRHWEIAAETGNRERRGRVVR